MEKLLEEKYIFYEEIGSGGSGTVFRAYDRHLQCLVAIKRFGEGDGISDRELRMLKELRHPVFPSVLDYMEGNGHIYLVMEYIEGRNLADYIREKGAVEQEQAVIWALELAEVLTDLHERKCPVIYRDMKPANVMIDGKGHVRLVDFGTAFLRYQEGEHTCAGGTFGYAAPEQFEKGRNCAVDEKSDIYGLGTTLFHMLTGCDPSRPPFLMQPIRFYDKRLSPKLEKVVRKATAQEKEKRYVTVRRMKQELGNYRRSDRIKGRLENGMQAAYGLALAALSFWYLWQWAWLEKLAVGSRQTVQMPGKGGNMESGPAEGRFLIAAACIILLCMGRGMVDRWRFRGCRGMRQEKNILLTVKRGKGLAAALLFGILAAGMAGKGDVWAKDMRKLPEGAEAGPGAETGNNDLFVIVRNEQGQKLLIRYDAEYALSGALKLELPLKDFEEGEHYELRMECINRETGEAQSRTLLLAP